jgi:hypothetical protein
VLKNSLYRQSLDNVTVVMIAFQNFKQLVFGKSKNSEREEKEALEEKERLQKTTTTNTVPLRSSLEN